MDRAENFSVSPDNRHNAHDNDADRSTYGQLSAAATDIHTYAQLNNTTRQWMCYNYWLTLLLLLTFMHHENSDGAIVHDYVTRV